MIGVINAILTSILTVFYVLQIVQRFAIVDLSNFYFDVAKDRLYVGYVLLYAAVFRP